MKTDFYLRNFGLAIIIAVFGILPLSSCSSDSDSDETTTEPDITSPAPPAESKVKTLVSNLQANDALSIDDNGQLFVSNFENFMGTRVVKLNPESLATETVVEGLKAPTGNITDSSGNIYVVHNVRPVEPDSNKPIGDVVKLDTDGNKTTLATLPGFPSGITLDDDGNVYVSNYAFSGVHQITQDGEVNIYSQDSRLEGGVGITFDDNGNLYVGNFITGDIIKIGSDKSKELLATIPTVKQREVIGYMTYLDGFLYATGIGEHVIYKVSLTGDSSILAGSGTEGTVDGGYLQASFDRPNGIVGDPNKNVIYVTEADGAFRLIELD